MKSLLSIFAVLALVASVSTGAVLANSIPTPNNMAAATQAKKPDLRGKITKIDGKSITITAKDKTETVITVTDDTTITIDKEDKKLADLKEGMYAGVFKDGDKVTKIVASTKMPGKKPAAPAA